MHVFFIIKRDYLSIVFLVMLTSSCSKVKHQEDNVVMPENPKTSKVIFAKDVSIEKGWKDTDKRGVPEDIMACWLITASNMIEWWQDCYTTIGLTLPEETPFGKGDGLYGSAVFDTAISSFTALDRGGNISTGLAWYIEGTNDISISDNHSQPIAGTGNFLKDIPQELREYSKKPFLSYSAWEDAESEESALQLFSKSLAQKLKKGDVLGLDIKTHIGQGGALHAITLWGAEFDSDGIVTKLYITDSDDYEYRLIECTVKPDTDIYKTKVITMQFSPCAAYPEGTNWEILRLFYLTSPRTF